jgi:hypothetical protein
VRDSQPIGTTVVELSSPLLNPYARREAGLFARVSSGDHPSWYWIALAPAPDGSWRLRSVNVLFR